MSRLASLPAAVLLAALLLSACGGKKAASTTDTTTTTAAAATTTAAATAAAAGQGKDGCVVVASPAPKSAGGQKKPVAALVAGEHYDVTIKTNCGSFTIRLDQKQSPHAAASFVSLVQHGFFNQTVFHRIVPGFVIQGGDPTGTGTGGPGYSTVDRPPATAKYVHGVVAMAKTGAERAGTAGSQFFVVTVANAGLPPDYAIIGKVISGLGVVDHIGTLGDASEQPTMVIEIQQASVRIS
jgi:peptidyl-prolyl cis-trans isomerase B (cyclophilin B)